MRLKRGEIHSEYPFDLAIKDSVHQADFAALGNKVIEHACTLPSISNWRFEDLIKARFPKAIIDCFEKDLKIFRQIQKDCCLPQEGVTLIPSRIEAFLKDHPGLLYDLIDLDYCGRSPEGLGKLVYDHLTPGGIVSMTVFVKRGVWYPIIHPKLHLAITRYRYGSKGQMLFMAFRKGSKAQKPISIPQPESVSTHRGVKPSKIVTSIRTHKWAGGFQRTDAARDEFKTIFSSGPKHPLFFSTDLALAKLFNIHKITVYKIRHELGVPSKSARVVKVMHTMDTKNLTTKELAERLNLKHSTVYGLVIKNHIPIKSIRTWRTREELIRVLAPLFKDYGHILNDQEKELLTLYVEKHKTLSVVAIRLRKTRLDTHKMLWIAENKMRRYSLANHGCIRTYEGIKKSVISLLENYGEHITERAREMLKQYYVDGYKQNDIARGFNTSCGAVSSNMKAARNRMMILQQRDQDSKEPVAKFATEYQQENHIYNPTLPNLKETTLHV